jgi:acetyl-CoA C-acetyltransferase
MAKSFRDDYILVKAVSFASGSGESRFCDDYDYLDVPETTIAAKRAYEQAGIQNPRKEISLAEVHDCFTVHELVLYEQLGFSPRSKAREDVEAETFTLNGELPINPDGGLKCFGHPLSATGLRMIYEVYKQLQGKAGPRQIKNASVGLTQNVGGMVGFFNAAVLIFGNTN